MNTTFPIINHMGMPKGQSGNPAGRPKGIPNAATLEFKQAVTKLLEYAMPEMVSWLQQIAKDNPEKALELIHKYAQFAYPMLSRAEVKTEAIIHNQNMDLTSLSFDELQQMRQLMKKANAPLIENNSED